MLSVAHRPPVGALFLCARTRRELLLLLALPATRWYALMPRAGSLVPLMKERQPPPGSACELVLGAENLADQCRRRRVLDEGAPVRMAKRAGHLSEAKNTVAAKLSGHSTRAPSRR